MGIILCATRGGEASYPNQDAVISLAIKNNDELYFFYVVDISFLDQIAGTSTVDVESRLAKLGKFQLVMAQERAEAQGLKAQAILRHGRLRTRLIEVVEEIGATLIVLGGSLGSDAAFKDSALQEFAEGLQAKTGVEVRILGGENEQ